MDLKNTCPGRITKTNFSWMPWISVYLRFGFCAIFNSIHYSTLELQSKNIVVLYSRFHSQSQIVTAVVYSILPSRIYCSVSFQIRFYVHDLIFCNSISNTFHFFSLWMEPIGIKYLHSGGKVLKVIFLLGNDVSFPVSTWCFLSNYFLLKLHWFLLGLSVWWIAVELKVETVTISNMSLQFL